MEATPALGGTSDALENVQHRDRVQQLQARLAGMRSAQAAPSNRHHVEDLLAQVQHVRETHKWNSTGGTAQPYTAHFPLPRSTYPGHSDSVSHATARTPLTQADLNAATAQGARAERNANTPAQAWPYSAPTGFAHSEQTPPVYASAHAPVGSTSLRHAELRADGSRTGQGAAAASIDVLRRELQAVQLTGGHAREGAAAGGQPSGQGQATQLMADFSAEKVLHERRLAAVRRAGVPLSQSRTPNPVLQEASRLLADARKRAQLGVASALSEEASGVSGGCAGRAAPAATPAAVPACPGPGAACLQPNAMLGRPVPSDQADELRAATEFRDKQIERLSSEHQRLTMDLFSQRKEAAAREQSLQAEVGRLEAALHRQKESARAEVEQVKAAMTEQLHGQSAKLKALEATCQESATQLSTLSKSEARHKALGAALETELSVLQENYAAQERELDEAHERRASGQAQDAMYQTQRLRAQVTALQQRVTYRDDQLAAAQQETLDLQAAQAKSSAVAGSHAKEMSRLRATLTHRDAEVKRLQDENNAAAATIAELRKAAAESFGLAMQGAGPTRERVAELELEATQAACVLEAKAREISSLRALLSDRSAEPTPTERHRDEALTLADREVHALRSRCDLLESETAALRTQLRSEAGSRSGGSRADAGAPGAQAAGGVVEFAARVVAADAAIADRDALIAELQQRLEGSAATPASADDDDAMDVMQLQCMLEAKDRELADLRKLLSGGPDAQGDGPAEKGDAALAMADREVQSLRRQVAALQGEVAMLNAKAPQEQTQAVVACTHTSIAHNEAPGLSAVLEKTILQAAWKRSKPAGDSAGDAAALARHASSASDASWQIHTALSRESATTPHAAASSPASHTAGDAVRPGSDGGAPAHAPEFVGSAAGAGQDEAGAEETPIGRIDAASMDAAQLRSELAAMAARHSELEVYSGEAMQGMQQQIEGLLEQLAAQQESAAEAQGADSSGRELLDENARLQSEVAKLQSHLDAIQDIHGIDTACLPTDTRSTAPSIQRTASEAAGPTTPPLLADARTSGHFGDHSSGRSTGEASAEDEARLQQLQTELQDARAQLSVVSGRASQAADVSHQLELELTAAEAARQALQQQLSDQATSAASMSRQIAELQRQLDASTAALKASEATAAGLSALQHQLIALREEVSTRDDEIRRLNKSEAVADEIATGHAARVQSGDTALNADTSEDLRAELAARDAALETAKADLAEAHEALVEAADASHLQDTLAAVLAREAPLQEQLASTQDELTATQDQLADTRAQLASTPEQLASAQIQLAGTQAQLASTERRLADVQKQLAERPQQLAEAQEQLGGTQAQLSRAQERLAGTEAQLATAVQERAALQGAVVKAGGQLSDAAGALKKLRARCVDLERRLQAAQARAAQGPSSAGGLAAGGVAPDASPAQSGVTELGLTGASIVAPDADTSAELRTLREQLAAQDGLLSLLTKERDSALAELHTVVERCSELEERCQEAQVSHDSAVAGRQAALQKISDLEASLAAAQKEADDLRAEVGQLRSRPEADAMQGQASSSGARETKLQAALQTAQRELAAQRDRADTADRLAAEVTAEAAALQQQRDALEASQLEAEIALATTEASLDQANEARSTLERQTAELQALAATRSQPLDAGAPRATHSRPVPGHSKPASMLPPGASELSGTIRGGGGLPGVNGPVVGATEGVWREGEPRADVEVLVRELAGVREELVCTAAAAEGHLQVIEQLEDERYGFDARLAEQERTIAALQRRAQAAEQREQEMRNSAATNASSLGAGSRLAEAQAQLEHCQAALAAAVQDRDALQAAHEALKQSSLDKDAQLGQLQMQLAEGRRRAASLRHDDKASPARDAARPGSALSSLVACDAEPSFNFLEDSVDFSALQ